ncbi:MAG: type II toxin-antitoxin system HicB family antitoxin [Candidatus Omnitrophota bacterium]|nr:type II toxin-antitoxin system HicB family antitoxin [Candidatus Omnitrophota bacterium]
MKPVRAPSVYHFTFVIEADETGGYYAFCPSLPGCYSQGETLEETKAHIREAIQCHLESLAKDEEPIPQEPDELFGTIQVTVPTPHRSYR